ncbi:DUF2809 domain-containing protein [Motilimonas sp. 1_MG-2023]|uniref:ribosomal maturation YjgA family protein n=1 Tax=Motilimonas sp. 1_MG-2023 TaxID=3062672 RepID=UPI0026E35749|nr:DUF2809 domain-containing protein [Motilimonas sp. 1_MG-2023]MDO6527798.1 DUF2809 domain-containing protein [Motilimonas sp. 1_MG-2023]
MLTLIVIALFIRDSFIRPFLGDVLVVIWLYLLLVACLSCSKKSIAIFVLAFACSLEALQYFQFINLLGLQDHQAARIIIGATFDWLDLVAYALGIGFIGVFERLLNKG